MAEQDRLYFDGQCPLCSFEMRHLAKKKHDSLELLDIHSLPDLTSEQRESLLKTLHLETHSGEVLLGLGASRYAWSKTNWSWLFSWLGWPVIKPVADRIYGIWAARRFEQRYRT